MTKIRKLPIAFNGQDHFHAYDGKLHFCNRKLTKIPGILLILCHRGVARVTIDFKEYTLSEFSQLVILPASTLEALYESVDFEMTLLYFPPTMMRELRSLVEPALFEFLRKHPHYVHPADRFERALRIFVGITEMFREHDNRFREQIANNLLINFFLDLYDKVERLFDKGDMPLSSRQEDLFIRFITLLHAHCTEEREVKYYAGKLCITPRYLAQIVKQITGKTPKDLIEEHIVAEMKALLLSTTLSVGEIAEVLHFPDQSFFGKFFKKQTGTTPREFRLKK